LGVDLRPVLRYGICSVAVPGLCGSPHPVRDSTVIATGAAPPKRKGFRNEEPLWAKSREAFLLTRRPDPRNLLANQLGRPTNASIATAIDRIRIITE
jgi:hypothetical protein